MAIYKLDIYTVNSLLVNEVYESLGVILIDFRKKKLVERQ